MRATLVIAIILSFTTEVLSQVTSAEDDDAGGTSEFTLSANASRVHLPIGHEVTCSATSDSTTPLSYNWDRACGGKNPWRTDLDWNVPTIVDCVGEPGKQTYRVSAGGKTAETLVEWHKPNEVFLVVGPPKDPVAYYTDGEGVRVDQILKLELCWHMEAIGPCAVVCSQEHIRTSTTHPLFEPLANRWNARFGDDNWWPDCGANPAYGAAVFPGLVTWNFSSPHLYDRQAFWGDQFWWDEIQLIPVGTVVMTKLHKYRFSGTSCSGGDWIEPFERNMELVIEIRTASSGWVGKVPVWRVALP